MSHLRISFEKELKFRVSQKTKTNQPEDKTLIQAFKYFDLSNTGLVNREDFYKTIIKIGINSFDKEEIYQLFDVYDLEKTGQLNYKEFASIIYGNATPMTRHMSPEKPTSKLPKNDTELLEAVEVLRDKIYDRGVTGLLNLAVLFKHHDRARNKKLEFDDFKNALNEFGVGLNLKQIEKIFGYFDKEQVGTIYIDDILQTLKGQLNAYRKSLIEAAFNKWDRNKDGYVEVSDLKARFDAAHHPDVLTRSRREKEVAAEFNDSIDNYLYIRGIKNKQLSLDEFQEYYAFLSSAIDNDQYFGALLNNTWRLNDEPEPSESRPSTRGGYKEEKVSDKASVTSSKDPETLRVQLSHLIQRLRQRIGMKGLKWFAHLRKLFRNADYDQDGLISNKEFIKILKDHKFEITELENQVLFGYYDPQRKGVIRYSDFMDHIIGDLSPERKDLVDIAWRKVDVEKKSIVHLDDVIQYFANCRTHPDVKSGKKTEDQIEDEYTETLIILHSIDNPKSNPYVNRFLFDHFLSCLSASIEDDKYFEMIITSVFKIQYESKYYENYAGAGKQGYNPKIGYLQDFHRSMLKGGSVSHHAPFGTYAEEMNRPSTAYSDYSYAGTGTNNSPYKEDYQYTRAKELFTHFRQRIIARGIRGFYGLWKHLKDLDEENTGKVSTKAFAKVAQEFRFDLSENELEKILNFCECTQGSDVLYEEFLHKLTGQLSDYRRKLATQYFERLDKDFKGYLLTDTLYNNFNVKNHPDVRYGKRSEDDVLMEFLDTFEIHHAIKTNDPKGRDKKVTLEEFVDYYRVVSATIPDDNLFEFVISHSWVPGGKGQLKGYYNPYYGKQY